MAYPASMFFTISAPSTIKQIPVCLIMRLLKLFKGVDEAAEEPHQHTDHTVYLMEHDGKKPDIVTVVNC